MDEIDALLYAPGSFRCDTCGFTLEKRVMLAATREVGIRKDGDEPEDCPNDGHRMRRSTWKDLFEDCATAQGELATALAESVKLQSHYAGLLNMHDGGHRRRFANFGEWMNRLVETGAIPKRGTR